MTAIADLTDLFVSASEYAGRADFAHVFDRFLRMAEDRLSKALRLEGREISVSLTADAQGRVALPSDFREARSVKLSTGYVLTAGPLDALDATYPNPGVPGAYAIGGGFINLRPRQAATVELTYWAGMARLTSAAPTNGVLTLYPDSYLFGVVLEILTWAAAKDDPSAKEKLSAIKDLSDAALMEAAADNERRTYSQSVVRLAGRWP